MIVLFSNSLPNGPGTQNQCFLPLKSITKKNIKKLLKVANKINIHVMPNLMFA